MISEYTIEKFKSYFSPSTLPIKPITLIFGPNSAGKSAIIKSFLLLKQSVDRISSDQENCLITRGDIDLISYENIVSMNNTKSDISFSFVFDAGKILKYKRYLNMPLNTKNIIDNIVLNKKYLCLKYSFFYSEDKNIYLKSAELYIENEKSPLMSFIYKELYENDYRFDYEIVLDRENSFWKEYWGQYGKRIAINELKLFVKNNVNCKIADDELYLSKFAVYKDLCEKIDNGDKFDENNLIDFFSEQILSSFFDMYALFVKNEVSLVNYEPDKDSDLYNYEISLIQIFQGLDFNNEKKYFSDNILIVFLILNDILQSTLSDIKYIGPVRKVNSVFEYEKDYSGDDYVGNEGGRTYHLLMNDDFINRVNSSLNKIGVNYNISIRQFHENMKVYSLKDKEIVSGSTTYKLLVNKNNTDTITSISDVGYGISQVLPIIVQSLASHNKTIIIEQPELHIHPALQSEIGDIIIDSALKNNNTFIVETHSEHLLLRILRRIRESFDGELPDSCIPIKPNDVSVVYINPVEDISEIVSIPITDDGDFSVQWPKGFFTEREKELF